MHICKKGVLFLRGYEFFRLDSSQKQVLKFFSEHPHATIEEAVEAVQDLSLGGVKFVIGKLQQKGLLKRVGGRKHGEWQTVN